MVTLETQNVYDQSNILLEATLEAGLNRPGLEYSFTFRTDSDEELGPEVLTEIVEIKSVGTTEAINVSVFIDPLVTVAGEVTVDPTTFAGAEITPPDESTRSISFHLPKLQKGRSVRLYIPLKWSEVSKFFPLVSLERQQHQFFELSCDGDFFTSKVEKPRYNYEVKAGDTIFSIARLWDVDPWLIAAENGIVNPSFLSAGQRLFIPAPNPAPQGTAE
jgi:LysM repeat protein